MNPAQIRRLARRLHEDRSRRIETLLVRLTAEGTLSDPDAMFGSAYKVLNPGYVWCDKVGGIHDNTLNPYGYIDDGRQDYCKPDEHRAVYVQSDDPNEEF